MPSRKRPPGRSSRRSHVTDDQARDMANFVLGLNLRDLRGEDERTIEEWLKDKDDPVKRDRAWTVIEVLKYEHPGQNEP